MLIEEIKHLANEIKSNVIADRRHLHAHPELSFCEYETSAFIKNRLYEMGIPWKEMANTGVIATIEGAMPSDSTIALRADIDALPIAEKNNIIYSSMNNGLMHACGHDAHAASLLGTAKILQTLANKFAGTVKLIFQPGEEKIPGGASIMIKEGVLKNPKPDAIIGQHVMPSITCGKIGIRKNQFMASMDELYITVTGKGGHAAQPNQNIDPVLITSHVIIALQQIVSRIAPPQIPTVLSFGKLVANGAVNIIPDEVYIEGTFRTLDEVWRTQAHDKMKKIAETIAEGMGGNCDFKIVKGYPFLVNNDKLTDLVKKFSEEYIGHENVLDIDVWMAAEDFAYYSQEIDSCFYLLGTGNKEKSTTSALHSPTFNIDEESLQLSIGLMAYITIKWLGN